MFDRLTLHGAAASLLWGYRPVAVLTSWRITMATGGWRLTATLATRDKWQVQQAAKLHELLFNAPFGPPGARCWELQQVDVGTNELRAILGHPLH